MRRRKFLAGISVGALPFSGCLTGLQSEKSDWKQAKGTTAAKFTTENCWEPSERQGFRIGSGYNDTVSLNVSVFEVGNQTERRIYRDSFEVDYQEDTVVRDSVFTKDTTYRVVAEGLGKTESKTIEGGDESWRLRREVYINIQEDSGLAIGSIHVDGNIPPACE